MTSSAARLRDRQTPTQERQRVLRSRNRFWRPRDLAGAPSTKQHLLAGLVESGELRHIRRGLYWRGNPSPLGMSPPPTEALIHEIAPGPGVGPAGLYAANLLRLSAQVPRRAEIAVPARAPDSPDSVKFVARPARTARAMAGLNATEVALLEVLGAWAHTIELPPAQAWARLRQLLGSDQIRPERLAQAGTTEPGTVRARLRELLRSAGRADLAEQVPAPDERATASATQLLPDPR
jgi:hypothetical protein